MSSAAPGHLQDERRAGPRRGALGQQGVHGETDTAGDERGTDVVEAALLGSLALRHVARREEHRDDGDRDVDEEDPAPAGVLGEDAADDDAGHAADAAEAAPHAERLRPLALVGEHQRDQRQRGRRHGGGRSSLEEAHRDEQAGRPRQTREQAGEGEHAHADDEQAAAAHDVGEAAAEEQQAAEGERVGVHDPRETSLRESEVLADLRQRDVDDGVVEREDDLGEGQDDECLPAGRIRAHRGGGQPGVAGVRRHRRTLRGRAGFRQCVGTLARG